MLSKSDGYIEVRLERKVNIGTLMAVRDFEAQWMDRDCESLLSTSHEPVIAINGGVERFPGMRVPVGTDRSNVSFYLRDNSVAYGGDGRKSVAFLLRCVGKCSVASEFCEEGRVVSHPVNRRVAFAYDRVLQRSVASAFHRAPGCSLASTFDGSFESFQRSVAFAFDQVPERTVASAYRSSPKAILAPALHSLRRAAQANKFSRIAGRLQCLAKGQVRQPLQ